MENSLDRLSELLNSPQPLKVDDRQQIFAGISAVCSGDSLVKSGCSALDYQVQEAIERWTGKQAIDYTPVISSKPKSSVVTSSPLSIFSLQSSKLQVAPAPLPKTAAALPIGIKPINIAPKSLAITGIKSSYEVNSRLSIESGLVSDNNGWQDISKVDFWLTDAQGKRIELADATTFTAKDATSAKFGYSTNIPGVVAGNYKLNAVAIDKAGAISNNFSQSIVIKPINIAPKSLAITGIKSSYEVNSKLSIESGLVSDNNGWQDISKVDFWLTDAQGKRIELADATTFTAKDATSAKFGYSTNIPGVVAGNYKLNAVAIDKAGAISNNFSQSIVIKPINIAPKSLAITGIKSSYEANSTLSIESGLVSDNNGWQDISKVDFWLTDAQGKRIELADASTFTSQDAASAKFAYSVSLTGVAAGNYKLNAVAIDKANLTSNLFTQSLVINPIVIKPVVAAPTVITPVVITPLALDIRLADPFNAFSVQQKQAFEIAVSNWERIITRDKDASGTLDIVAILSKNDFNGISYLGTPTGAEAFIDPTVNGRANIDNDQVPAASPVDINGVDYQNRINVNYYYLQEKPSTTDLVVTLMHEIGHALGLDHDAAESLMGAIHFQDRRSTLSGSSFTELEKLGYKVDRNAQIKWA